MKVLLVNAKPSLVDSLAARSGIEVSLLWPRRHHFSAIPPPARVEPMLYAGGPKLSLRAAWQLRRMITTLQPDIVHAFYGRALAHVVLASTGLRNRPRIVSFRGITSRLSRLNAADLISYRHPLVEAHACESDAVRQSLVASGINANRCFVTYNTMRMAPTRRPGRAALQQFGIPASAFVIGTMATMRRVKGVDILLRAAAECADLKDLYLLLLGRVVDPEVRVLATNPCIGDRVRLVGHRADASELISAADLFVMPSRAEALCQALLEAMHQGVCPVVSDAGGMKEVVRHGQDGIVFRSEEFAALARVIRMLYHDRPLLARYAASARARIASQFTPECMAERCLTMYRWIFDYRGSREAA
ncbi:MAG TPA: glycosyltransferase family 4 protein [Lacipirellulaceae bacterium]|jgi:glycosyltransferase involved in cell wall biosynthesis|nr:glycosyltransferase family 4 protein [Lacipirellulaceae bacterium]